MNKLNADAVFVQSNSGLTRHAMRVTDRLPYCRQSLCEYIGHRWWLGSLGFFARCARDRG